MKIIQYVCDGWTCFIRADRDCWTRERAEARQFADEAEAKQYLVANRYDLNPLQTVFADV